MRGDYVMGLWFLFILIFYLSGFLLNLNMLSYIGGWFLVVWVAVITYLGMDKASEFEVIWGD